MRFEEIKAYREHKIININLIEKEKMNLILQGQYIYNLCFTNTIFGICDVV